MKDLMFWGMILISSGGFDVYLSQDFENRLTGEVKGKEVTCR